MRKIWLLLVAVSIITCFGAGSLALAAEVQPKYTYIDLGSLGGSQSYPSAVNDLGMAVGESQTADPDIYRAFLWTKDKGIMDLGGLSRLNNGTVVNLDRTNAWALNFNGSLVVGETWNADYISGGPNGLIRAFLWQKDKGMTDLGTLGGKNSGAYWCNSLGWVVGQAETLSPGIYHAFYWTKATGLKDLDNRPGKQSMALAVNNLNQVAGQAETSTSGIFKGFLWAKNKGMKFLEPLPGGSSSLAYGLNYLDICGISDDAAGATHAVLWHIYNKFSMVDLGNLGGQSAYAWNINALGQVVGISETKTHGVYHAFTWNSAAGMKDLNDMVALPPDITLSMAYCVNNIGQILVQAEKSDGTPCVFLLSPIQSGPSTQSPVLRNSR